MTMDETTAVIGAEHNLVATFASDPQAAQSGVALVLTNSGVIPRAGPHRMNVHLARCFAKRGIPSVRFDMSGLGDSRRASGRLATLEQWSSDTQSAMDAAQQRFGTREFIMIGFCSGAEVAHVTAMKDERIRAVVLWDSFSYPTLQSQARALVHRIARVGVRQAAGKAMAAALWRRLSPQRPGADTTQGRMWQGEPDAIPPRDEYRGRLKTLVDRGVRILVMHSGGEPLSFNYRKQFDHTLGREGLKHKIDFEYLDLADHLLTRSTSQTDFIRTVSAWIEGLDKPATNR